MATKRPRPRTPLADLLAPVAAFVVLVAALFRRPSSDRDVTGDVTPSASTADAEGGNGRTGQRHKGIKGKLYAAGERFRPLGVALKMNDRFGDVNGNYLAGAVTLQSFISLFPLLLLVLSVAGFVVADHNSHLAGDIIGRLGLTGQAAMAFSTALERAAKTRGATLGIGTVGLLWSGLGLVGSIQFAYDQVWQVEQRGVKDKLVGAAWLLGAAVLFLASAAITTVLGILPGFLWPVGIVFTLAVNVALWLWTAKLLPNRDVGWRPLLPGAILGGVGLEVLKIVGRFYVPHLVASSSAVYGSIGVVFAILAWLFFFGRLIVYSACLNVVLYEEEHGTVKARIEVPRTPQAVPETDRSGQSEATKAGRAA